MKHHLQYWRPDTAADVLHQGEAVGDWILDHSAGDQLRHVKSGDILWIITMEAGRLYLIGRMEVDVVVSQREAERILRTRDLWEAKYHALAVPGTESDLTVIDITDVARKLRFQGTVDRLPAGFSGRNLQSMRTLTNDAADLLETTWSEHGAAEHPDLQEPAPTPPPKRTRPPVPTAAPVPKKKSPAPPSELPSPPRPKTIQPKKVRGQATNVAKRKAVELHAMQAAISHFRELGYKTEDVSSNKPYDLICRKGREEFFVEVKGMQAGGSKVTLTHREVGIAQDRTTKTALFIVYSINVKNHGKVHTASGGFVKIINPWSPSDDRLTATQYTYSLPD